MKYVFPAAPLISWLASRCVCLWVEGPARLRRQRPVSSPSTTSTEEGAALSVFPFGSCVFVYFVFVRVRRRWVGIKAVWMWGLGWDDRPRGGQDVRIFGRRPLHHPRIPCTSSPGINNTQELYFAIFPKKFFPSNWNHYLTGSCWSSAKYILWIFGMNLFIRSTTPGLQ